MRWARNTYGTSVAYTSPRNSTSLTFLKEEAVVAVGSTAGSVTLQWAQNASNATGTVVATGSFVRFRQIG
jgi:hypothetical protein